jgi:hypothetical protein
MVYPKMTASLEYEPPTTTAPATPKRMKIACLLVIERMPKKVDKNDLFGFSDPLSEASLESTSVVNCRISSSSAFS